MLNSAHYADGEPVWLELSTPDLDRAEEFYAGLFGWSLQRMGPDMGNYGLFKLHDKTVAAVMPLPADKVPPAWTIYFKTPDAAASARTVERNGGTVTTSATDVMDLGRLAACTDPQGAAFAVWEPGTNTGLEIVTDTNAFFWAELESPEPPAAVTFYGRVFGWETTTMHMEGGDYLMPHPAGGTPEDMFAGVAPLDPATSGRGPYWLPYFNVADCDATAAKALAGGASTEVEPLDIPDVGRMARFTDPHGAVFAVMTPNPRS
ncbi:MULTISPECIES: VOC family protein [Streptomyces]|uniref:VOC family protein n=1 Tax=Streptomyces evansiae TaxID=3075535 RepID=A0ABU2QWS1_9ACTN|nr:MULTISPECIES: VOC family protein [unclassified Streptomyces]MDT0408483.1 VOC family protein [Streptomyces sp. DSM 41979]MYQ56678.1 VOC family protein [Streptomyces sp. SID4926]NJA59677.1 VOC family protein [Streptomyces sp. NEAU-H3]